VARSAIWLIAWLAAVFLNTVAGWSLAAQDVPAPVASIKAPEAVPLFDAASATLVPLDVSGSSGDQVLVTAQPARTTPVRLFDAGKRFLGYTVAAPDRYTFVVVVVRHQPGSDLPLIATQACGVLVYAGDKPPDPAPVPVPVPVPTPPPTPVPTPTPNPTPVPNPTPTPTPTPQPGPTPTPGPMPTPPPVPTVVVPASTRLVAVAVYKDGSIAPVDLAFANMLDANPDLTARMAPYCEWFAMDDHDERLKSSGLVVNLTPGLSPQLLLYTPADATKMSPAVFYKLDGTVLATGDKAAATGVVPPMTADGLVAALKKIRGVAP
jgi:hypothetical protein